MMPEFTIALAIGLVMGFVLGYTMLANTLMIAIATKLMVLMTALLFSQLRSAARRFDTLRGAPA
jgi:hypothetical protein